MSPIKVRYNRWLQLRLALLLGGLFAWPLLIQEFNRSAPGLPQATQKPQMRKWISYHHEMFIFKHE